MMLLFIGIVGAVYLLLWVAFAYRVYSTVTDTRSTRDVPRAH